MNYTQFIVQYIHLFGMLLKYCINWIYPQRNIDRLSLIDSNHNYFFNYLYGPKDHTNIWLLSQNAQLSLHVNWGRILSIHAMLFISSTRIISFRQQRQPGNGNVEVEGKKILIMNIINKMLKLVTTKRFSCDINRAFFFVTFNLFSKYTVFQKYITNIL